MKQPFRFFRGELNGFFVNALCTFLNTYVLNNGFIDELIYHITCQWILEEDEKPGVLALREDDIYGIGKIGGLMQPRATSTTNLGSIRFTSSNKVNGSERSERGLFDMNSEYFKFKHANEDNYSTDINILADEELKSTLVESGREPVGYVLPGAKLYNADGTINESVIRSSPPSSGAYDVFYGAEFLTYEKYIDKELPLSIDIYMALFEAIQRIRKNGISIISLIDVTELLGEGYICNIEINQHKDSDGNVCRWYDCYYDLDDTVYTEARERRYIAWQNVVEMKFKLFNFYYRDAEEEE